MDRCFGWMLICTLLAGGCLDGQAPPADPVGLTRLRVDRTYLRDAHGRYVFFHGINVSGTSKLPAAIGAGGVPTYVGKPFALDEAHEHFARLREMGFSAIRLLVIWEGIEPVARGRYDTAYLDFIRDTVRAAGDHGLYVLLDMHQDMFSRHLRVDYNRYPDYGAPGSVENALLSLVDPATHSVQGDGAPRWAVEACLQEKDLDSAYWGTPRLLGGLDRDELENIWELYRQLLGLDDEEAPLEEWVVHFLSRLPGKFEVNQTSDLLPFTFWGISHALSLDVARCYGCLLAGRELYPELEIDGQNVEDYLQQAFAEAWAQVAARVAGMPNVLGYDIMNEPGGNFLVLTAVAAMLQAGAADGARDVLVELLGEERGEMAHRALLALKLLPPDTEPETLAKWGLDGLDLAAALGLNYGFDRNHLAPFYGRVGRAILEHDPEAIFFIEGTMSLENLFGGGPGGGLGGMWAMPMTRPEGLEQVVYAPHWYADIYPVIGFNQPPRSFDAEEVRYRDYRPDLESTMALSSYALGNTPAVFGEFGTYFNLNGIAHAEHDRYRVPAHILDNYYEAFEQMFMSRFLWCYSPENDREDGDGWNLEDFSILDWRGAPRGQVAWSRPHARALAGKPVSTRFFSDLHYFDPDKGVVDPVREFEVRYASKETEAPTEIVVPPAQYPDGFYVWVTDGVCMFDPGSHTLYHHPADDRPGAEHAVRIAPPIAGRENTGWNYFYRDGRMVDGSGP